MLPGTEPAHFACNTGPLPGPAVPPLPRLGRLPVSHRLPSIRLARPRFVMTAECESPVVLQRRFTVTYTLINHLQDFLAVRLVWTPESTAAGQWAGDHVCWKEGASERGLGFHTPPPCAPRCEGGASTESAHQEVCVLGQESLAAGKQGCGGGQTHTAFFSRQKQPSRPL